jgi:hypothetical protein
MDRPIRVLSHRRDPPSKEDCEDLIVELQCIWLRLGVMGDIKYWSTFWLVRRTGGCTILLMHASPDPGVPSHKRSSMATLSRPVSQVSLRLS